MWKSALHQLFLYPEKGSAVPTSTKHQGKLVLGDHIRKRRLDLGLLQSQVAEQIGVTESTIYNWESGAYDPGPRHIPKIHAFLGYCPLRFPKTFGEKLRVWREALGLTQEQLAMGVGVDKSTIREWEIGLHKPTKRSLEKVRRFFGSA